MRAALMLLIVIISTRADQVAMTNGDRYTGSVIAVTGSEVQLQNDIQGAMRLPRSKVTAIFFNQAAAATGSEILIPGQTNAPTAPPDPLSKLRSSGVDAKTLDQVQNDILGTAGPEAQAMFADLLKGLTTGKLGVEDIRKQASDATKELKALQKELGEGDDDAVLANYLAILQKFIDEGKAKPAAPSEK